MTKAGDMEGDGTSSPTKPTATIMVSVRPVRLVPSSFEDDQTESLGGLEVDHEVELRGLLDRELSGLSVALQDRVHVGSYSRDRIQVVPP
jgi:hypothetical protein